MTMQEAVKRFPRNTVSSAITHTIAWLTTESGIVIGSAVPTYAAIRDSVAAWMADHHAEALAALCSAMLSPTLLDRHRCIAVFALETFVVDQPESPHEVAIADLLDLIIAVQRVPSLQDSR